MMKMKKSAPFSFHCIICFDAFDLVERPPVVLPCGHTYVCEPCSKRLTKCMECRTSLFTKQTVHSPPPPLSPRTARYHSFQHQSRYHRDRAQFSPPNMKKAPQEQVRLPLPRNQVMMTLMELSAMKDNASVVDLNDSSTMDEFDDDEMVLNGIDSFDNDCGTYVVKDRNGLTIQPPNSKSKDMPPILSLDEDSHMSGSFISPLGQRGPLETTISYGQRVQIASISDNGVFKLARNKGYIVANHTQLVKVGGPMDRACKTEGILSNVTTSRQELEQQLERLKQKESNLYGTLQSEWAEPEQFPVISESLDEDQQNQHQQQDVSLSSPASNESMQDITTKFKNHINSSRSSSPPGIRSTSGEDSIDTPAPVSPPNISIATPRRNQHDLFVDQSDDEEDDLRAWRMHAVSVVESGVQDDELSSPFRKRIMCGTSLFPGLGFSRSADASDHRVNVANGGGVADGIELNYDSRFRMNHILPRNLQTTVTPNKLDFRTGLSGHMALSSTSKDGRRNTTGQRGEIRMMSEHRGIASIRPMRKTPHSPKVGGSGSRDPL